MDDKRCVIFALIQVFCKLLGITKLDFEVTSKVFDSEVAKSSWNCASDERRKYRHCEY